IHMTDEEQIPFYIENLPGSYHTIDDLYFAFFFPCQGLLFMYNVKFNLFNLQITICFYQFGYIRLLFVIYITVTNFNRYWDRLFIICSFTFNDFFVKVSHCLMKRTCILDKNIQPIPCPLYRYTLFISRHVFSPRNVPDSFKNK